MDQQIAVDVECSTQEHDSGQIIRFCILFLWLLTTLKEYEIIMLIYNRKNMQVRFIML